MKTAGLVLATIGLDQMKGNGMKIRAGSLTDFHDDKMLDIDSDAHVEFTIGQTQICVAIDKENHSLMFYTKGGGLSINPRTGNQIDVTVVERRA